MKVSVIIPTHNRGRILVGSIKSYFLDSCVREVIVIDDGSTDDTLSLLEQIQQVEPRLKVFTQENSGAPVARNLGIEKVDFQSEFIFFGEDDACLGENAITKLVECILINQADIAGGMIVPVADLSSLKRDDTEKKLIVNPVNLNLMRANFKSPTVKSVEVPFIHALFLARKWVFEKVKFDNLYYGNAYREETDFCLQASRLGAKIMYEPVSLVYHMEAPCGGQRRINKFEYEKATIKNNWYFLNKHYDFLKKKYGLKMPKIGLQLALILRRCYLLCKYYANLK